MKFFYSCFNVPALLVLFLFLWGCKSPVKHENDENKPATIAAIENDYYTNGNFKTAFSIALRAAAFYHKKNDAKGEAEALLWLASLKKTESNYPASFTYLNRVKPLLKKIANDSLYIEYNLLKGGLLTLLYKPDSAKWYFNEVKNELTTKGNYTLSKARLYLASITLYDELRKPLIVDSLTKQAIKILKDQSGYGRFYYGLALVNRVLSINKNGNTDSAFVLTKKYGDLINHSFPKNNYLNAEKYYSSAQVNIENMDYVSSVKYAKMEIKYAAATNNSSLLFDAYYNLEQAYYYNLDFKNSLSLVDSMNNVRKTTFSEKSTQSSIVNNSYGLVYSNTHDYKKAKYYFLKNANDNRDVFGKDSVESIFFNSNIANLYSYQEKYDSAVYYCSKLLKIEQKMFPKDNINVAYCMDDLARNYSNLGKPKIALPYQVLVEQIYKKKFGPTHSYVAWAYDEEADSYSLLKQFDRAIEYNNKAFELFIPNVAKDTAAINNTAAIPFDIYIPDYFESRVTIVYNHAMDLKDQKQKIYYLKEAYRLCNATNNYLQSFITHFDSPENVSQVYIHMLNYYKMSADIAYQLYQITGEAKYRNSVLNYSENKRGNFLRSSILSSKSVQFSGVPNTIIDEEAQVRNAVTQASAKATPTYKKDSVNIVYERFLKKLALQYHNYYKIKYLPYTLNEQDVQHWLPDSATIFTEYLITRKQIYLMVISKKQSTLISLNKQDSLLTQISSLNELLKKNDTKAYYKKAYDVYSYLVKPLEKYVKPGNKIIISADGPLAALSFEALVTKPKSANNNFNSEDFLLNKYNFSYVVSAFSMLNPFQTEKSVKVMNKAYFTAPGFDDKLKKAYKQFATSKQLSVDNEYLAYLYQPFMIKLGNTLSDNWEVTNKEGKDATESDFKQKAPGNNILQVGSHALLNNTDPMKSCLVFAKELTTDSTANDGYLYSSEIYNQKLNADLVILTACETGAGEYKDGEGMMSLSYGFEYAGCKSAIMSLWPIDEKTASTITEFFYKHLSEGQSTADALYNAKKDYLKTADATLANPFYWSGLVLLGNDEKIQLNEKSMAGSYSLIFGGIALIAAGAFGFRKRKTSNTVAA